MEKKAEVKAALTEVTRAAEIHLEKLEDTVSGEGADKNFTDSFKRARRVYIRNLTEALLKVKALKFDEEFKLIERVSDLSLEDSLDLLEAVQDHIRNRPRTKFSEFQ